MGLRIEKGEAMGRIFEFVKREWCASWAYLRKRTRWIVFTALFLLEVIALCLIKGMTYVPEASSGGLGVTFFEILFGNLRVAGFVLLSGVIPLCLGAAFHGGLAASFLGQLERLLGVLDAGTLILCVLPHAAFELFAIFLSYVLAALVSRALTLALFRKTTWKECASEIKEILRAALVLVVPSIFLGAIMESTLSTWITAALLT